MRTVAMTLASSAVTPVEVGLPSSTQYRRSDGVVVAVPTIFDRDFNNAGCLFNGGSFQFLTATFPKNIDGFVLVANHATRGGVIKLLVNNVQKVANIIPLYSDTKSGQEFKYSVTAGQAVKFDTAAAGGAFYLIELWGYIRK